MTATELHIPAIILAAGKSSRLGTPKQLVRIGDETLLERSARIVAEAGVGPIIVVLGAHISSMRNLIFPPAVVLAENTLWEEGVASSIRAGMQSVLQGNPEAKGVLLLVCDQPAVTVDHLDALLGHAQSENGSLTTVASFYAGVAGTPAFFPAERFTQLLALHGDKGARSLLRDAAYPPLLVPLSGGEIDIDTANDLSRWQEHR